MMDEPIYNSVTVIISAISAIISIVSVIIANNAFKLSKKANEISEKAILADVEIARRQGVVNLTEDWKDLDHVINDKGEINGKKAVRAANALHSAATAWNHDIVSKPIMISQYWPVYKELYEEIQYVDRLIPGLKITLKSVITRSEIKAYEEMKKYDLGNENQTTILK